MNRKKFAVTVTAAALLLGTLAGCGNRSTDKSSIAEQAAYDTGISYEASTMQMPVVTGTVSGNGRSAANTASISLPENRKWVITMNLSAETENLDDALEQLTEKITASGGYVESQSYNGSARNSSRRSAYITVRVPTDQLDGFVENVSGMTNVVSSSRYVEDITLSYTDTEGRVNALKTEEARLLELMEQAETVSDLLDIEERLTEVRYQLENYTSTLRRYDNQVDYATVSLSLSEVEKYTPPEKQGFWEKVKTGLGDSIVSLGEGIVDFAAWVIIDLPYLVLIGLAVWLVSFLTRRGIKKRKAKKKNETK